MAIGYSQFEQYKPKGNLIFGIKSSLAVVIVLAFSLAAMAVGSYDGMLCSVS